MSASPWIRASCVALLLDLIPPYELDMRVLSASARRYERAFLTIHVTKALGRPLSRRDLETSLWRGGTLSVMATCQEGDYVAERVAAAPPP